MHIHSLVNPTLCVVDRSLYSILRMLQLVDTTQLTADAVSAHIVYQVADDIRELHNLAQKRRAARANTAYRRVVSRDFVASNSFTGG